MNGPFSTRLRRAASISPSSLAWPTKMVALWEPRHEIQHQYPANARFCPLCAGVMELRTVLPDHKRHKVC